jgi:hypothetical protein
MSMLAKLGLVGGVLKKSSNSNQRRKSKTLEKILLNGDMQSDSEASTPGTSVRARNTITFGVATSDPPTPLAEQADSPVRPLSRDLNQTL